MTIQKWRLSFVFFLCASGALACGFHNYTPQPTLVDRLSARPDLILARPSVENPFRFVTTRTVGGARADADIPFLVDTSTRRRLAADPEAHVLFARKGAAEPWERIAFVDDAMSDLLDDVLLNLESWAKGDTEHRVRYFARLIEDNDRVIRRLALREIDQADYRTLKAMGLSPSPKAILPNLYQPGDNDLLAIRILLLGFSDTPDAHATVRKGLARVAPVSASLVGAYATAFIEQHGATGVLELSQSYLSDASLPAINRELLVEALAIHSQTASEEVRLAAQTAMTDALKRDADLAPMAARQFGSRLDWSQAEPLTDALREMNIKDPGDMITVAQYVRDAKRAAQVPNN